MVRKALFIGLVRVGPTGFGVRLEAIAPPPRCARACQPADRL